MAYIGWVGGKEGGGEEEEGEVGGVGEGEGVEEDGGGEGEYH